ncbi:MAG: hypothetical protein M3Y09_13135 [Actinomycetota bacterium]|nr:hypothetical protein [Actinomycetota bacterium]
MVVVSPGTQSTAVLLAGLRLEGRRAGRPDEQIVVMSLDHDASIWLCRARIRPPRCLVLDHVTSRQDVPHITRNLLLAHRRRGVVEPLPVR